MKQPLSLVVFGLGYSASAVALSLRDVASRVIVTARSQDKVARLSAEGWEALAFDGTGAEPALREAVAQATHILVSAPPGESGDPVLSALGTELRQAPGLSRAIYLSTVGVYGDHQGGWVDETSPLRPVSRRSRQRVAAEEGWQRLASEVGFDLGIFRLSGIYGPGRSAIDNLRAGTARRIVKPGQVFNRIHRDDIAGAIRNAMLHEGALGIFNLTDDEPAPPQDVVAHAASLLGMEPPPEIPFEEASLSEMGRSFYGENKRVSNARIKSVLGYHFRCPTYREGLAACLQAA